jgi:organic hydroperoxide reductase OsmC/OhrA
MGGAGLRPKRYPYRTSLKWDGADRATERSEGRPAIEVAPPPDLKGPRGLWSPEHLLVASLESCILLTFLHHLGRRGIALVSYESEAAGTAELGAGGMEFTEFTVRPRVVIGPGGDVAAARQVLEHAAESCLVHRSLKSSVRLEPEVTAAPA